MKLAVYAIIGRAASPPVMRGVLNERLRLVRMGMLTAIVGDVSRPPKPSEANLRRFASLIARLASTHRAILPARFGTVMRDTDEVEIVLGARQAALRKQLAHVRGRVQMTIRLVVTSSKSRTGSAANRSRTGTSYLRARADQSSTRSIPEFRPLGMAVRRWVADERVERKGKVVTIYHLVPARAATGYADAIEKAALESGARGFVSGPWPPYAFADTW